MKRIELLTTNCNAYFENKSGGCFAFQRLLRLMYIANASATCPIHFATFSSFLIINISKKMIVCDRVAWSISRILTISGSRPTIVVRDAACVPTRRIHRALPDHDQCIQLPCVPKYDIPPRILYELCNKPLLLWTRRLTHPD